MSVAVNFSPLHALRFAKFTLHLEAVEDLHLPQYKGSTFRGGFGSALKKAVCMTKTFDCPPCLLQQNCPYISIFEPKVEKAAADLLRIGRDAPQPFVLEPPLMEQREFKKGEQFSADIVLIGKAMDMLPHFIYTFTVLGERVGLGKAKGRFAVRQVTDAEGKKVYDGQTQMLKSSFRIYTFDDFAREVPFASRLTLTFTTPTRIMTSFKANRRHLVRLRDAEDFGTLIETLYHRLFVLTNLHCASEASEYMRHKIEVKHMPVSLVAANIRWQDWERYSNRQQTRMKLGGFVGEATFEGELAAYMPLLTIGEHLHVGKGAGFGLGKFVVSRDGG